MVGNLELLVMLKLSVSSQKKLKEGPLTGCGEMGIISFIVNVCVSSSFEYFYSESMLKDTQFQFLYASPV